MSNGINSVLMTLAEAATRHEEEEKRAFVPMPGGAGGGGGIPPMDPAMAGGAMPPDPMAMAAGGADPAAIMAAGGAPVDPMMAAAGGAGAIPPGPEAAPPPAEGAPAPTKGGGQKEKLEEIHTMLSKILGVLVGKGLLQPDELGGVMGQEASQAQATAVPAPQEGGIPSEQKIAEDQQPERVGTVVNDKKDVVIPAKKASEARNALAALISSLDGGK